MGAVTPLVQGFEGSSAYRRALVAHLAGGALAGVVVGVALAYAGAMHSVDPARAGWVIVGLLGVLIGLRELGIVKLPLPQAPRQTVKAWRHRHGPVRASFLWGLDLGSGLTTYVPYAGYWLLPVAVLFKADVLYGAAALGLFALGRTGVVAVTSLATRNVLAAPGIDEHSPAMATLRGLASLAPAFRRQQGYGVLLISLAFLASATVSSMSMAM